jgi:hypothetical protein
VEFVMRCRAIILAGALSWLIGAGSAEARLEILVEKASQRMVVIQDGYMRYIWPVSTGRDELETPNGTYAPQRLERSWFSREYYNSPMPNAIFFHGGYAIHGSYAVNQLGGPASHGCVRLHPHHAALLFDLVQQEGPGNTTIEVTDEPRPDVLPPPRENDQAREISAAPPKLERLGELGDMAELSSGPRVIRQVTARTPPLLRYPPAGAAVPRLEHLGELGDMAELSSGPRAIRPVTTRTSPPPPPPPPLRYPPAERRRLTSLIEAVNSTRAPCGTRADSPDCRPRPKPVERALQERADAAPAAAPPAASARPERQAPSVYGFKVLPGSCWSGSASRWRWWQPSQSSPCK